MANQILSRVAWLTACLWVAALAACGGGGGGGGGGLSLSFSPQSVAVSVDQGQSVPFGVTARISGSVEGGVVIVVHDSEGVIEPRLDLSQLSAETYQATLYTALGLSPGQHKGTLEVSLCSDQSCRTQYGAAKLPYTITVTPIVTLDSLSPSRVEVGSAAQELTLVGSRFESSAQVYWNGQVRPSIYQSSSSLTVQLSAEELTREGMYSVFVSQNGKSTQQQTFLVTYETPALESLSPNQALVGDSDLTVTLNGSQFHPHAKVYWDGTVRPSVYESRSRLTTQLSTYDLTPGRHYVQVIIPSSTLYQSQSLPFDVSYPVPSVQSISPNQITRGAAPIDVTITGSGFTYQSQVRWNGSVREGSYSYVSPTQMTLQITSNDLEESGVYPITVINPTPGGGVSASANFTVNNPVPNLNVINAKTAKAGCERFVLTAIGTDLVPGVEVLWNGSPRPTTQISDGLLQATIEASDIAQAGEVFVSLRNPSPGGGNSDPEVFKITTSGAGTTAATEHRLNAGRNPVATTDCPVSPPSQPAWTYSYDSAVNAIPNLPLIADGKVMVADSTGRYLALDAAAGTPIWGPVATGLGGNAAYDNGNLFIVGGDDLYTPNDHSRLAAYNTADGSLRYDLPVGLGNRGLVGVTVANGLVYSAFNDSTSPRSVYAFRPVDGVVAWQASIIGNVDGLAVNSHGAYVTTSGAADDALRALDPNDGSLLWEFSRYGYGLPEHPSVVDGVVYSVSSYWIARNREADGVRVGLEGDIRSNVLPTVLNGVGYLVYNNALSAQRLSDNSLLWNFVPNQTLGGFPVVVNDLVLTMADSTIYALDASTGLQLWKLQAPVQYTRTLTVGDGYLALVDGVKVVVYSLSSRH